MCYMHYEYFQEQYTVTDRVNARLIRSYEAQLTHMIEYQLHEAFLITNQSLSDLNAVILIRHRMG